MPTFIILVILFIIAAFSSGCQTSTTTAAGNTAQPAPKTSAKPEEPQPPQPQQPKSSGPEASSDTSTIGSLATPTEAYKTAYELRRKKDVQGLKQIMSADIKEFLTMMGEDGKKSLDDMIKEMCDKPQADRAESRSEKIKGDMATVEYLTEKGDWKTMDFEKVDGKWLLTLPKGDADEPQK